MCGWEWYHPTTLILLLSSSVKRSASVAALSNWSDDISTRSFFLSERLKIMTADIFVTPSTLCNKQLINMR